MDKLVAQTVKLYVLNTLLSLGMPDPREQSALPLLKRLQVGISRARESQGHPAKIRLPITAQLLRGFKVQDIPREWSCGQYAAQGSSS